MTASDVVVTDIPARLDRLPWGRFHKLVIAALGITWILDGLEVTVVGAIAGALRDSPTLQFTSIDIGWISGAYLAGAVIGALFFGWLTDRLGRKKLFFITLAVYSVATAATSLSWDFWSFATFRFLTGAGIGGEYAAINSTIQELIPARMRGWTDLVINGSFWLGAALGAVAAIVLLDPALVPADLGWRLAFGIGAALSLLIFFLRLWIPESPRWLITHGHAAEAENIMARLEQRFRDDGHAIDERPPQTIALRGRTHTPLREVAAALLGTYRQRAVVGFCLMASQAFFYNAIFFTYALVLIDFYHIPSDRIGWYLLPFAAGNFLGPLLLGRFFDSIGRKTMIVATYTASGSLLAVTGALFAGDAVSASALTAAWTITFFFASAAASSAYLTVSETFPLEIRALAIACFYAIGTGVGGVLGPFLMSHLIASGSRFTVFAGYLRGAVLMIGAAVVAYRWTISAERRALEDVAKPLAAAE